MSDKILVTGFSKYALAQEALTPGYLGFLLRMAKNPTFPIQCTIVGEQIVFPSGYSLHKNWLTDKPVVEVTLIQRK